MFDSFIDVVSLQIHKLQDHVSWKKSVKFCLHTILKVKWLSTSDAKKRKNAKRRWKTLKDAKRR